MGHAIGWIKIEKINEHNPDIMNLIATLRVYNETIDAFGEEREY